MTINEKEMNKTHQCNHHYIFKNAQIIIHTLYSSIKVSVWERKRQEKLELPVLPLSILA